VIVLDDGGGLIDLVRRVLGWGPPASPAGPPAENTADQEHVARATREVTERAGRAERVVRDFTERQRREIDTLRERVRFYEERGGG
jgi:hypothetical protein